MNPGWIYILTNRSLQSNYLKIGRTVNDPSERASEISSVTGVAVPFSVAYSEVAPDCVRAEWLIHQKLASYRVNANREFFQIDLNIAQRAVSEMCEIVRNESPLCQKCKAKSALMEVKQANEELQKYKRKLKHLQETMSMCAFCRTYISIVIAGIDNVFRKIVPERSERQIYIWGLIIPLCITGWIILLTFFPKIAMGIGFTIMLIAAIIVIGRMGQKDADKVTDDWI